MSALTRLGTRMLPARPLRRWFMERIRQRRGQVALPFELEYRHVYVLPTPFGWAFGAMLVLMALGGLNFNNNLALLMVFILGILSQMTTLLAYRNLAGLRLDSLSADPVFCGDPARFRVFLANREERPRFAIGSGYHDVLDCVDLPAQSTGALQLEQPTHQRGWLEMAPFHLENRYPLGLFRAWSWHFPDARCLVYPAPAEQPPPLPTRGAGRSGTTVKGEGEQLHGLREYRPGDSPRRVAWRTSARHDALYTREMETPRQESCELNWHSLTGADMEKRLSILTSWVLLADSRQLTYSLILPGSRIGPAQGAAHRSRCLEALALFQA